MSLLIGLDVGTTSVKAGIYDPSGRQLGAAGEEYQLVHPAPDRAELDPEIYWAATKTAIARILSAPGVNPAAVSTVTVSSQGETVVAVSEQGLPLAPALVWLDNRAVDEAQEIARHFDDATLYAVTGVPSVVPTWTACKILWWRRQEPEVFARARRFLLVEDFILHRLTGRFVTDGSVACTSLLYDIVKRRWWERMLDVLEVDPERLPELVAPGAVIGTLTATAAEGIGLPEQTLVVAGGMDQCAGAVGVGNVASGVISESTGGGLALQASVDRHGADPTRQTPVYIHSAPGRYLYCPVCPTGGMVLTWFRNQFGADEIALAERDGGSAYDLLTALAANVAPGADGLTMLPHLMGAFSPEYEPEARGAFYGFTLHHGKGHFVRAVLESIAFMLRRNLELLAGVGAEAHEIRSHGGGARSTVWNQIKADVCGLPVVTLQGEDAAIRGDAMLAGIAAGVYPDLAAASTAMVRTSDRFQPDPDAHVAYNAAYARYVELFEALRPLYGSSSTT